MSGWTRLHPRAPGDKAVTVSVSQLKHAQVLRVRIPHGVCREFGIEEDEDFIALLDGTGKRLRFTRDQTGDVTARAYGKSPRPNTALTIAVGMLAFDELFTKQAVEWARVDGDLVVTLPQRARAA